MAVPVLSDAAASSIGVQPAAPDALRVDLEDKLRKGDRLSRSEIEAAHRRGWIEPWVKTAKALGIGVRALNQLSQDAISMGIKVTLDALEADPRMVPAIAAPAKFAQMARLGQLTKKLGNMADASKVLPKEASTLGHPASRTPPPSLGVKEVPSKLKPGATTEASEFVQNLIKNIGEPTGKGAKSVQDLLDDGMLSNDAVKSLRLSKDMRHMSRADARKIARQHGMLGDEGEFLDPESAKEFDEIFKSGFIPVKTFFVWLGY
jgi:hypothetical protein